MSDEATNEDLVLRLVVYRFDLSADLPKGGEIFQTTNQKITHADLEMVHEIEIKE